MRDGASIRAMLMLALAQEGERDPIMIRIHAVPSDAAAEVEGTICKPLTFFRA